MVDGAVVIIGFIIGVTGIFVLIFLFSAGFKQWNESPLDPEEIPIEERNKMDELKGKDYAIGLGIFALLMMIMSAC